MTAITLRSFSSGRNASKRTYDVASRRDGKRFSVWPEVHKAHRRSVSLDDLSASPSPHITPLLDSPTPKNAGQVFRRRWQHLERGDFDDGDERVSEAHWAIVAAVVSSTSIVIAFFVFVALAFHARANVVVVRHRAGSRLESGDPVHTQVVTYGVNFTAPLPQSDRLQMYPKMVVIRNAEERCSAAATTSTSAIASITTVPSTEVANSSLSWTDCKPPECE
ncbi:hypothetical protein MRX96_041802 [Rhipicephalus microplus]